MKDILVLSTRKTDFHLVLQVLSNSYTVKYAPDFETAMALHILSPFDMIMSDITLLEQNLKNRISIILDNPFIKINPFVQLVVLCGRKDIQRAVKTLKKGAFGYLTYPIEEKEIQLLVDSAKKNLIRDLELDYLRDHFWKTEWLENILERAYILENFSELTPLNFPSEIVLDLETRALPVSMTTFPLSEARQMAVGVFERSYLTTILEQTQGKINLSARKAGITTRQLSRLLAKYGLNKKNFKQG